jgi:hypothetical protein
MANKVITGANVRFSSGVKSTAFLSGEAISIGQPVYLDQTVTPNVVRLSRANALATSGIYGLAMNTVPGPNQTVDVAWYDPDFTPAYDALVAGEVVVVSAATLGAVAPITDLVSTNYVSILGGGKTGGKMILQPLRLPDPKP